jgi:hypothetical protein
MVRGRPYETLAICRSLALARAAFTAAIEEKPVRVISNEKGAR